MGIFQAVLLGILQGIAEFLPISASKHIVICGELLERFFGTNLTESKLQLNVALHFGTLVSILVIYQAELSQLIHQPRFFCQLCWRQSRLLLVCDSRTSVDRLKVGASSV